MMRKFSDYIEVRLVWISNYGDWNRGGEAITSSFAKSTVNRVISRWMVKKQKMQCTEAGVHRSLQVLNDDLRATFHHRYSGLKATPEPD